MWKCSPEERWLKHKCFSSKGEVMRETVDLMYYQETPLDQALKEKPLIKT